MKYQIPTLLLACLFLFSCVNTSYKEYADNGQIKYNFKTYGDFGVSTSAEMNDSLRAGAIPLLGGRQGNDYDITQTEGTQDSAITIGENFKITGTVVHSTGMGVVMKGSVRIVGAIAKAMVFWKGISAIESTTNAKTGADLGKTQSGDGVKMNDSNNSLKGLESNNATKVELEALKLE